MERREVELVDTFNGFEPFQALSWLVGERGREWEYLEDLLGCRECLALRFLASVWERPTAGEERPWKHGTYKQGLPCPQEHTIYKEGKLWKAWANVNYHFVKVEPGAATCQRTGTRKGRETPMP